MSLNQIETTDFISAVPEGEYNFDAVADLLDKNDPELEAAKNIIEQGGDTNNIKKLDPTLASLLVSKSKGKDSLELAGLTYLDEDTARQLANFDGKYLVLTGLNDISAESFHILKHLFVLNEAYTEPHAGMNHEYVITTGKYLVFNVNLYAKCDVKYHGRIIINDNQYLNVRIQEAVKSSNEMPSN